MRSSGLFVPAGGRPAYVEDRHRATSGTLDVSFLLDATSLRSARSLTVLAVRDKVGRVLVRVELRRHAGRVDVRVVRGASLGAWRALGTGLRLVAVTLPAGPVAAVRLGAVSRSGPASGTQRLTDYRALVW